ncbi:hypothetical protein [Alistipes sp. ZOR0009]|jgi:hypothetical protein|uniref:hypothetical protein n=1 Tax=Alistipes sp. ZOR0009 TaxID=1339253 RepID=UPI000B1CBE81|nr:hypothetical protein [Alistipes sp. ZOR0009]
MKKQIRAALDYAKSIIALISKDAQLSKHPGVAKSVSKIKDLTQIPNDAKTYIEGNASEFTSYQLDCKDDLVTKTQEMCSQLESLALTNNDKKQAFEYHTTPTTILRNSDPELITFTKKVLAQATAKLEELKKQEVEEEQLDELELAIQSFEENYNEKQQTTQNIRVGMQQTTSIVKNLNEELRILDIHMQAASKINPAIYAEYQKIRSQMRQQKKVGHSLMAKAYDATSKRPLNSVIIEFIDESSAPILEKVKEGATLESLGIKPVLTKKTSPRGICFCPKMNPGKYIALATMHGFVPEIVPVFINENNTFELNIGLTPVNAKEAHI